MNRGQLVALDTPAGLKDAMRTPLLEMRTSDAPRAARILAGVPEVLSAGMFGRTLHVTVGDPERARPAIEGALGREGVDVTAMEPIPPSLEDVFIHLVREAGGAPAG
jgi:ABC-2 type transport system ATP-binding protein